MINYLNPDFSLRPGQFAKGSFYQIDPQTSTERVDVSIITPYFNTEPLFEETLNSILNQSLQNWEMVIVDDGSTDKDSIHRLDVFAKKDVRIRVIRQENAGPSAARNTAVKNSSGRYLCLLDSDDLIEQTYLEKCAWFLDSYPEFAFCNSYSAVFGAQQYLWTLGFERNHLHLQANSGPPISVIRRQAYDSCGGFDESIRIGHEDWDFWLAMAKNGHWGYTIPEFLQWYRKRENGRFEEFMRKENANDDFAKLIAARYKGLEANFPVPKRRHPQPFETLPSSSLVHNPLLPNPNGRRVMFIVPWMVPGGADRVNLDLIEGLLTRGHHVTVCATLSADHKWEHQFAKLTPDVFVLPNILHLSDYPRFLGYLMASRKIDTAVLCGSTIGYQLLPYLRTVSPKTAFIDLCHVEEPHWLNGGHPRFAVGYQGALDLNVATTKHLANWMVDRGALRSKIRVMYTGIKEPIIDHSEINRIKTKQDLGITHNLPIIIFAGRICEQKRPAILAEILRRACEEGIHFHTLVIGDGELRGQFESLINQFGLNKHVSMLGTQPHEKWLELLTVSDILLLPSQYEGISIALLEAMSAGVVPVVSNVGGQNEIVNDRSGFLISHGANEIEEYVLALKQLIKNKDQRKEMASQCRALIAEKFSWKKTIIEFEEIIAHAHEGKNTIPLLHLSVDLAEELALTALENKRLSDAVDWLWGARENSQATTDPTTSSLIKLAVVISRTKFGRYVDKSEALKSLGKFFLQKFKLAR